MGAFVPTLRFYILIFIYALFSLSFSFSSTYHSHPTANKVQFFNAIHSSSTNPIYGTPYPHENTSYPEDMYIYSSWQHWSVSSLCLDWQSVTRMTPGWRRRWVWVIRGEVDETQEMRHNGWMKIRGWMRLPPMMIEGGAYTKCRRERARGLEGLRCRRRAPRHSHYKAYAATPQLSLACELPSVESTATFASGVPHHRRAQNQFPGLATRVAVQSLTVRFRKTEQDTGSVLAGEGVGIRLSRRGGSKADWLQVLFETKLPQVVARLSADRWCEVVEGGGPVHSGAWLGDWGEETETVRKSWKRGRSIAFDLVVNVAGSCRCVV